MIYLILCQDGNLIGMHHRYNAIKGPLQLMKVVQLALCMGCNKTEDMFHFLLDCDQNKDIREKVFGWVLFVEWKYKCDSEYITFRRSNTELQVHWTGLCQKP